MKKAQSSGSVLVGLLWCVALLAVFVTSVLYTGRLDLQVAKNYGDSVQAYYLAVAGVEKAKAVIYHDAAQRKGTGQNHTGAIFNDPDDFRDVRLGRGQFRVIHQGSAAERGRLVYGVSDEESRLNVNVASPQQLTNLYGLTMEIAAAILDWRDGDNNPSPGGAEAEYYESLRPRYLPRNGRIQTARELLLVRGISPDLLMGEDTNQNGILDPEEDDGDVSYPPDNRDGNLDAGWSGEICFESVSQNLSATGNERVNVQSADEATLTGIPGITTEIAKAIVGFRDQRKLENMADLLEVSAMSQPSPGAPPPQGAPGQRNPGNQAGGAEGGSPQAAARPQPVGPKLISEELLLQIADEVTTVSESAQPGLINVNTASAKVLRCLPGVTAELAQAIINHRSSSGYFPSIAHLLKVPGISRELFKQFSGMVTVRSETFRIVSEGKVGTSGAQRRIEVIVKLGTSAINTVSYRENL